MSRFTIAILLVLAGLAAVMLTGAPRAKPRAHTIDAIDLMRLHDAKRAGHMGRRGRAAWVILATAVGSLLWALLG